jgi:hypothetical protein
MESTGNSARSTEIPAAPPESAETINMLPNNYYVNWYYSEHA